MTRMLVTNAPRPIGGNQRPQAAISKHPSDVVSRQESITTSQLQHYLIRLTEMAREPALDGCREAMDWRSGGEGVSPDCSRCREAESSSLRESRLPDTRSLPHGSLPCAADRILKSSRTQDSPAFRWPPAFQSFCTMLLAAGNNRGIVGRRVCEGMLQEGVGTRSRKDEWR